MEEARESLAADGGGGAEASAEGALEYSQWTQQAKQVLGDVEGEDGTALETMDALAKVSDRYALDADAVSHLRTATAHHGVEPYLGMIGGSAHHRAGAWFPQQLAVFTSCRRMLALLLAVLVTGAGASSISTACSPPSLAGSRGRHLDVQL